MGEQPITQRDLANAVQGATLAVQLSEVIRDIAELRSATAEWQNRHDKQHSESEALRKREADDRRSGRRWVITTAIAGLVLLCAILGLVFQLVLTMKR